VLVVMVAAAVYMYDQRGCIAYQKQEECIDYS
jgi:hypothetical protein